MNTEPENFDQLRKLLALKKYEQPPPGYFNELPGKIWTRIEKENITPSIWSGFLSRFVLRPTAAYGFALVVCATLIVGIGTSLNDKSQTAQSGTPIVQQQHPEGLNSATPALAKGFGTVASTNDSSTNPVIPIPAFQIHVQPVAFDK
jgi:hypothetical protein